MWSAKVRPLLEYGNSVIGFDAKQMEKVERVLRFGVKKIMRVNIHTPNVVRAASGLCVPQTERTVCPAIGKRTVCPESGTKTVCLVGEWTVWPHTVRSSAVRA